MLKHWENPTSLGEDQNSGCEYSVSNLFGFVLSKAIFIFYNFIFVNKVDTRKVKFRCDGVKLYDFL